MQASDFPVTFGYGRTDPPYGTAQFPYHRGEDRYMPDGTPIVVNNHQIGFSGHTGFVTGPHLHTGRFAGGGDTNPNGGGLTLQEPVRVTTVAYDDTNGNYVRLTDGAGVQWVYLHMSNQTVEAGTLLDSYPIFNKENDMVPDEDRLQALFWAFRGRAAVPEEVSVMVGDSYNHVVGVLNTGPERDSAVTWLNTGKTAVTDNWELQIVTLEKELKEAQDESGYKPVTEQLFEKKG